MKRSKFRGLVREILVESLFEYAVKQVNDKHFYDTEFIHEDTTLRSLVAKADSEKKANRAVKFLSKRNVQARAAYPSKFGLQADEVEGWGVYVEPGDVQKAAEILASVSKGLTFDPYVNVRK